MSYYTTVAVYGTLRYGAAANGLMKGCKYLGKDKVSGRLYSLGAYPGLLPPIGEESPEQEVSVDVYAVPDENVLTSLDRYEGYYKDDPDHSLYNREKTVTLEGGMEVEVYIYNSDRVKEHSRIKTGDWFDATF